MTGFAASVLLAGQPVWQQKEIHQATLGTITKVDVKDPTAIVVTVPGRDAEIFVPYCIKASAAWKDGIGPHQERSERAFKALVGQEVMLFTRHIQAQVDRPPPGTPKRFDAFIFFRHPILLSHPRPCEPKDVAEFLILEGIAANTRLLPEIFPDSAGETALEYKKRLDAATDAVNPPKKNKR